MKSTVAFSIALPLSSTHPSVEKQGVASRRRNNALKVVNCQQAPSTQSQSYAVSRRNFFKLASTAAMTAAVAPGMLSLLPTAAAADTATSIFELPDLPYKYNALEPHISEQIMKAHHDSHFAAYVKNLNAAVAKLPPNRAVTDDAGLRKLLANLKSVKDASVRKDIRNNGGGYLNHKKFFAQMAADPRPLPDDAELAVAIQKRFGTFEKFQEEFLASSAKLFGSGFTWLVMKGQGEVDILQTPNQDNPAMTGQIPILACDCWEHSWYYQYGPLKKDYFVAWWKVIDWPTINAAYVGSS